MESSLLSNKACLLKHGLLDERFHTPTTVNMELCTSPSHHPLALHFGLSPSFEFLECGDRTYSSPCLAPKQGTLDIYAAAELMSFACFGLRDISVL